MRIEQLFIAGLGAFLPRPVSVREAVADGRYDAREAEETRFESILVADGETPRILLEREYFAALRIPESATTWPWGRRVGHLGAGDQIAGFGHLVETNALQPGQRCLLMGVGAGFTWTCAVIELLERPSHPSTTFSL